MAGAWPDSLRLQLQRWPSPRPARRERGPTGSATSAGTSSTGPKGAIAVLGDSVGYGLTTVGNVTGRLAQDGWGPLRSYTQLGLHAAPEKPLDPDTVVRWIGEFRARGLAPRAVVVISGANDVGYPAANDVNRNMQRIETAMKALGNVQVVWTTIHHNRPDLMAAWNQALVNVDAKYPNLRVCDWAAEVVRHPQYLERDKVHMTVGATGGYAAMREFVAACARAIP